MRERREKCRRIDNLNSNEQRLARVETARWDRYIEFNPDVPNVWVIHKRTDEMAELILYVDGNFGGLHTHIFESTPRFTQLAFGGNGSGIVGNWNDRVSSFVIVSGTWLFFKDENFRSLQGNVEGLGPGLYPSVNAVGIDNDALSSVRLVHP